MNRRVSIKIVSASFHRNGIGGEGFYAVLFDDEENGRMIASLFDEPGCCAVYNVEQLAKGNVAFANGNSWRGDVYEAALRPMLQEYLKAEGTMAASTDILPGGTQIVPVWECKLCGAVVARKVYSTKKKRESKARFDELVKKYNLDCAA